MAACEAERSVRPRTATGSSGWVRVVDSFESCRSVAVLSALLVDACEQLLLPGSDFRGELCERRLFEHNGSVNPKTTTGRFGSISAVHATTRVAAETGRRVP